MVSLSLSLSLFLSLSKLLSLPCSPWEDEYKDGMIEFIVELKEKRIHSLSMFRIVRVFFFGRKGKRSLTALRLKESTNVEGFYFKVSFFLASLFRQAVERNKWGNQGQDRMEQGRNKEETNTQ